MRLRWLLLLGLLVLAGVLVWGEQALPRTVQPGRASASAPDTDGDGVPDPVLPDSPQPGEDVCPLVAEDPDGIDDEDGCPDSDASVTIATEEQYTVTQSAAVTKTVEIWVQNGNYPADILAHALSVSSVGACEVSLVPAAGDQFMPFITDEDGDTIEETFYYMLEWEFSLGAGGTPHTSRDYEVVCASLGEHSFEIQVDVVPLPPVQEEDVLNLRNVRKSFPLVTVLGGAGRDSDGDGFSDEVEAFVGTQPMVACGVTPAADDEEPDASPPDFNDDETVNIVDAGAMRTVFNSVQGDGRYAARKDLNADGSIKIIDVGALRPFFNKSCAP